MNDKQQLAAMYNDIMNKKELAEKNLQEAGVLNVPDDKSLCIAKRVEELEGQARIMAELLRDARRYVSPLSCPEHDIPVVQSIVARIDAALSGAPETKP